MRNVFVGPGGGAVLAAATLLPACAPGLTPADEARARASGDLGRRAEEFIALVRSADPAAIDAGLAEGLTLRRLRHSEGEQYSFRWNGRHVLGHFRREDFKDPKVLDLRIDRSGEGAARVRVSICGRHCYEHFVPTGGGVSFSWGHLDEALADLGGSDARLALAVHWLANHPDARAVPGLIRALGKRYDVPDALRRTTFQLLSARGDWERWYEAERSKSREEWRGDATRKCLALLASEDLTARIEGAKLARLVGGVREDVRKALAFPDEAYATSVVRDADGYTLVVTNRTARPVLIAIREDDGCKLSYSWTRPADGGPLRGGRGWGRASLVSGFRPEQCLRALMPGESRKLSFSLPRDLGPGEYRFRARVCDVMNGRTYEAGFERTLP